MNMATPWVLMQSLMIYHGRRNVAPGSRQADEIQEQLQDKNLLLLLLLLQLRRSRVVKGDLIFGREYRRGGYMYTSVHNHTHIIMHT